MLKVLTASDSYLVCDSVFCWLVCFIGGQRVERIPGPDFFSRLFDNTGFLGRLHYFFGDTPDTLLTLARRYTHDFSLKTVPGNMGCSPAFESSDSMPLKNFSDSDMTERDPIVWVGLGCPKQDKVCGRIKTETDISVCISVGAAFRFEAGTLRRARPIYRSLGLEWVWRFLQEPVKTGSRLMGIISALVFLFGSESKKRV
ncbi:WecB/TagA/CpsF family glycosyltransferase [Litorivicinus sp.]|nr:WecB/TagA/CpsF family glycosyltransferase [Litorivicinus sp.]